MNKKYQMKKELNLKKQYSNINLFRIILFSQCNIKGM